MKLLRLIFTTWSLLLVLFPYVSGQGISTDFERVRAKYKSLTGISAELEYVVYQGHDGTRAVDVKTGLFKSDMKNSYVFVLAGIRQCHNPTYDIVVSEEDRSIVVKKNTLKTQNTTMLPGIDTADGAWRTAVKVGEGNGIRTWRISFKNKPGSEYEKMDITIDTQTFLIRSISLYYRAKMSAYLYSEDPADNYLPKMTITYRNVRVNPTFGPDEFSETKYIQTAENEIKPSKPYANYELLIQNP